MDLVMAYHQSSNEEVAAVVFATLGVTAIEEFTVVDAEAGRHHPQIEQVVSLEPANKKGGAK